MLRINTGVPVAWCGLTCSDSREHPKLPGTYRIEFGREGHAYIGHARNFFARWNTHWNSMRDHTHQQLVQEMADLVGPSRIHFGVLQCAPLGTTKKMLEAAEYLHMTQHLAAGWRLLNILLPAEPGSGLAFRIGHGGRWAR